MKKIIFSISLCLCLGFTAIAQDSDAAFVNKRGIAILPEKGDFAIGIDASPVLSYVGSFFSNYGSNAPSFLGYQNTIYGKYFLQNDRALRARLTFGLNSAAEKSYVTDHKKYLIDPLTVDKVIDIQHNSDFNFQLGIGYEFRRGKGRVQGFYGGELALGLQGQKQSWDRGNAITTDIRSPYTCTNFSTGAQSMQSSRTTEVNYGNTFSLGLSGFAGVEYFFAPNISIGGEFGLGINLSTTGEDQVSTESWNTTDNKYQAKTVKSFSSSPSREIKIINPGGAIFIMFHF